jgi:hypothetical protein
MRIGIFSAAVIPPLFAVEQDALITDFRYHHDSDR